MKRNIQIVFLLLVIAVFVTPLTLDVLHVKTGDALSENRRLSEKPQLSMETLEQFPSTFECYYNDNFPLRTQTVKLYNNLCYYLLNDACNSSLAVGKEKWIYFYDLALPSQTTVNDYKHTALLNQEDLAKIAEYLTHLQEETEKQGGTFYFMIAPNKNEIYPEYMPPRIKVMDEISSLDQLETYLEEHTDISVIKVKQALLDGKGEDELYYSNGTHWNYTGSYVGYQELAKAIEQDFPEYKPLTEEHLERIPDPFYQKTSEWGDLSHSQPVRFSLKDDLNYVESFESVPEGYNDGTSAGFIRTLPAEGESKAKALVFRDSFATWLQPYLSQSFDEVAYYWKYFVRDTDIQREQPNVFIYEVVQRNIPLLLEASKTVMAEIQPTVALSSPVMPNDTFRYSIDKAALNPTGTSFDVIGWSFLDERDTAVQKKYVQITLENSEVLTFPVEPYFSDIGAYFQNSKYDYARFDISIPLRQLSARVSAVEFIIKDEEVFYGNGQCKIEP